MVTLADIEAARERIAGGVYLSPCVESIPLSQLTGAHIFCKLDYLQRTGSFKERGARNALLLLTSEQRRRGVIAASAGNHAQGIAYHGRSARHPDDGCDAEIRRAGQGDQLPPFRRQCRAARRRPDRSARACGNARRARRPDVHPSVRQPRRDRGPGHDRARDPGADARGRSDRRPGRRRRAHRRNRHRDQGEASGHHAYRRRAGIGGLPHRGAGSWRARRRHAGTDARRRPRRRTGRCCVVRNREARRRPGGDRRRGVDRPRDTAPRGAREERGRRRGRSAARRVHRGPPRHTQGASGRAGTGRRQHRFDDAGPGDRSRTRRRWPPRPLQRVDQ